MEGEADSRKSFLRIECQDPGDVQVEAAGPVARELARVVGVET